MLGADRMRVLTEKKELELGSHLRLESHLLRLRHDTPQDLARRKA
jgi:hypothetical protein